MTVASASSVTNSLIRQYPNRIPLKLNPKEEKVIIVMLKRMIYTL